MSILAVSWAALQHSALLDYAAFTALWATPRKYDFLSCDHLDFESAVTAQNEEFKGSFDSSYSRLSNVKT